MSPKVGTLEAGHKAIHVLLGLWAVFIVVQKREAQYRLFALTNGILWGTVAIVGWTMPDYLGLVAFNRLDTILHTIVAGTGLLSALLTKGPLRGPSTAYRSVAPTYLCKHFGALGKPLCYRGRRVP